MISLDGQQIWLECAASTRMSRSLPGRKFPYNTPEDLWYLLYNVDQTRWEDHISDPRNASGTATLENQLWIFRWDCICLGRALSGIIHPSLIDRFERELERVILGGF